MLSEYNGASNSVDIFKFLVGEKITAAFKYDEKIFLVLESGDAFVMNGNGSYWRISRHDVDRLVALRRAEIQRKIDELRDLPGLSL